MTLKKLLGMAGMLVALSGAAHADKAVFNTFLEPNHPVAVGLEKSWIDELREKTGGAIDFDFFPSASLVPAKSGMQAVADGIAQAGMHSGPYTPSELPVSAMLGDLGWVEPDDYVVAAAFTDFIMHDPVGYNDWRKNGVVFIAGLSTPYYVFLCHNDLATLADLQGKKIRTSGQGWSRFVEFMGAIPVNITTSELYVAMERGAVDCASLDPTQLRTATSLEALTKSLIDLHMSPAFSSAGIVVQPSWWQGLSDDQRRLALDAAARGLARMHIIYNKEIDGGIAQAREKYGLVVHEPDEALVAARTRFVDEGIGGLVEFARTQYGVEDPQAVIDSFLPYLQKWKTLYEGVDRMDEEAVTALLKANLYDSIDASTYGME